MTSHPSAADASGSRRRFDETSLRAKMHWSVPEAAFMTGLGVRSVWRLMSDPRSRFPKPRRVLRRTLLVAAEVMEFMAGSTSR